MVRCLWLLARRPARLLPVSSRLCVGLKLAPHGFESIGDRHIDVAVTDVHFQIPVRRVGGAIEFVRVQGGFVIDDQFLAREPQFDANMKWSVLPLMPVQGFDNHLATRDAVEEGVKLIRFLLDALHDRVGMVNVTERSLDWLNHSYFH